MTRLRFLWKNIIYSFVSEKDLAILILLGMVICDVIFFAFGNVFWSDAKTKEYKIYESNIVTFQFEVLDIEAFLGRTDSKDFITSTFFEHTILDEGGVPLTIAAYSPLFSVPSSQTPLGNGLSGSYMEFAMSSLYVTRRSFSGLPTVKMGDTLFFLGNDWKFAGILSTSTADSFDIVINIDDFQSLIQNDITARFRFRNGTSLVEIQDFSNALQSEFHALSVMMPSKTAGVSYGEFLADMSGMFLLLIIAIINYMFLYQFLLTKRTYLYGIYKAYGLSNLHTLCVLYAELLFFLVISYALGILIYYSGLFVSGQASSLSEHAPEFIFAFFTITVLNLLFGGIAAMKLILNSPAKLIKESVVT